MLLGTRPSLLLSVGLLLSACQGSDAAQRPAADAPRAQPEPRAARAERPAFPDDMRGITISCWGIGKEWGSEGMRQTMLGLPEVGANWVAIHPYAHVDRQTANLRPAPRGEQHVVAPIRWAREQGLSILIKPHLSYWGEFSWRGEVGWGDDEKRWQNFLTQYRRWILGLAELCEREGAHAFVVGTELRLAEPRTAYWTKLIAEVRQRYSGPLTYAANWDDVTHVGFWSELDAIGIQAYMPLSDRENPPLSEVRAAWKKHERWLAQYSREQGRPVVLTEVGYTNIATAAMRPWEPSHGKTDHPLQARCLRTALETVESSKVIKGSFIWKWFPTPGTQGPDDFTVQTPAFKRLLRETWAPPARKSR